ncbi:MAG: hypothetical protein JW786_00020, partial [Desulfobacterales bacterium]|nr:hypothetical protein [Desulfobacterales bacterium]
WIPPFPGEESLNRITKSTVVHDAQIAAEPFAGAERGCWWDLQGVLVGVKNSVAKGRPCQPGV